MTDPRERLADGEATSLPASLNVLHIAWQHKSLVALAVAIALVLGGLYYARQVPIYQSQAQIMVVKKAVNPLLATADPRTSFYEDYLSTHQELLRSEIIVAGAVKKGQLQKLSMYQGGDPTLAIIGGLEIKRPGKDVYGMGSTFLSISFRGTNADECPKVIEAVIDSYKDFLAAKYKNISDDTLNNMTRMIESLHRQLVEANQAYDAFRQATPLAHWQGTAGTIFQEQWLTQIQNRRLDLLRQRAELRGRIQILESALKDGRGRQALLAQLTVPGSKSDGNSRVNDQMFELLLKEQLLLSDYGPDHPEVIAVRKRMALTRDFFLRGSGEEGKGEPVDPVQWHLKSLRQELQDLEVSLEAVNQLYEAEQKGSSELAKYKEEDQRHRSKISGIEKLLDPYKQRMQEIDLVRDIGGYNAEVVALPRRGSRVGLQAYQVFLAALLLGLVGGVGLAYLAEITDRSFRTPEEIRRRLGLPVLGHIPVLAPDAAVMRKLAAGEPCLDPLLCTVHRPKSVLAESYRGIRTNLYFSTQGEGHRVIQVTSPNSADGKSTLVANLAVAIAQSGKKTIIVDCDLRKPRQHKIFNLPSTVGVASVLAEQSDWKDAVQETSVPGLSLMASGPHPPNPAELLTSPRFKELLDAIREAYDFVLIDSPPLLAVTDPSAVAPRVDGVLLVMRILKNGRPQAERACEILSSVKAKVLGVTVNGVGGNGATKKYGYESYHYAYNYHYSYGDSYYHRDERSYYPGDDQGGAASPKEATPARPAAQPTLAARLVDRLFGRRRS